MLRKQKAFFCGVSRRRTSSPVDVLVLYSRLFPGERGKRSAQP